MENKDNTPPQTSCNHTVATTASLSDDEEVCLLETDLQNEKEEVDSTTQDIEAIATRSTSRSSTTFTPSARKSAWAGAGFNKSNMPSKITVGSRTRLPCADILTNDNSSNKSTRIKGKLERKRSATTLFNVNRQTVAIPPTFEESKNKANDIHGASNQKKKLNKLVSTGSFPSFKDATEAMMLLDNNSSSLLKFAAISNNDNNNINNNNSNSGTTNDERDGDECNTNNQNEISESDVSNEEEEKDKAEELIRKMLSSDSSRRKLVSIITNKFKQDVNYKIIEHQRNLLLTQSHLYSQICIGNTAVQSREVMDVSTIMERRATPQLVTKQQEKYAVQRILRRMFSTMDFEAWAEEDITGFVYGGQCTIELYALQEPEKTTVVDVFPVLTNAGLSAFLRKVEFFKDKQGVESCTTIALVLFATDYLVQMAKNQGVEVRKL